MNKNNVSEQNHSESNQNQLNNSDHQDQVENHYRVNSFYQGHDKNDFDQSDELDRAMAEKEAELEEKEETQIIHQPVVSRGRGNRGNRQPQPEQNIQKGKKKQQQFQLNGENNQQPHNDSSLWVDDEEKNKHSLTQKQQEQQNQGRRGRQRNVYKECGNQKSDIKVENNQMADNNQSDWDKQQKKQEPVVGRNKRNKVTNEEKQEEEQAEIEPDKQIQNSMWSQPQKKQQQPVQQNRRVGGRRGNRGNGQATQIQGSNNKRGNRSNRPDRQQRDFNQNGYPNYRRDNRQFNNDNNGQGRGGRDFNGQRGRGGFRGGRGGFRGNDGGRGGFNRDDNNNGGFNNRNNNGRFNQNNQNDQQNNNNQRNFRRNHNNVGQFNANPEVVVPIKPNIEPQGSLAWPQVSLHIRKCRLTLTLRTLRQHESDCLFFPFFDLNFSLYPSSLINKSSNIRKRIQQKLAISYFDTKPYIKEGKQFGKFKYVGFIKLQKDKEELGILQLLKSLFDTTLKIQSYVLPICKQFGDFNKILPEIEKYIEHLQSKKELIKQVYLTTKDPSFFKEISRIFLDKISEHVDGNRFYIQ